MPERRYMMAGMTRDNQNAEPQKDVIALPLTLHELSVVMRSLGMARESERTDAAARQAIDAILERIDRFAQRQGAWWDAP